MPPLLAELVDSRNNYVDLSGVKSSSTNPNPYDAMIEACENNPVGIPFSGLLWYFYSCPS